jgi:ABC-type sugar transport system ATPase subunit
VSADGQHAVAVAQGTVIEARGVVKSFGQTPALRGATIAASRGEILAVMGPSGSGKSTLLHCLAGIVTPDEGEVWFGGRRLDRLGEDPRSDLRLQRFGFIFQSGQLVPELTAEENIALPLLLGGTRRTRPWPRPANGSPGSAWTAWSDVGPESCPAARRSAWRWAAAWWPGRRCCSPTSRPGRWTRWPGSW